MRISSFASGSSGNCTLVETDSGCLLIDAGISMRRIKEGLSACGRSLDELSGILITHEHTDHVSGLKILIKHCDVPIYAPRTVANHLRWSILGIEEHLRELTPGETESIGDMSVTPFHTPHDTDESVGYRIEAERVFALATDMGCVTDEILQGLIGADAVIIESNHDIEMLRNGRYPIQLKKRILSNHGHLSNADCASLALKLASAGTRYIVLGHLSRDNNMPELALREVSGAISEYKDVMLAAAPADRLLSFKVERSAALC